MVRVDEEKSRGLPVGADVGKERAEKEGERKKKGKKEETERERSRRKEGEERKAETSAQMASCTFLYVRFLRSWPPFWLT